MRALQNWLGRAGKSFPKAARGGVGRAGLALDRRGLDGWTARPSDFASKLETLFCNGLRVLMLVCGAFDAGVAVLVAAALGAAGRCQVRGAVAAGETGGGAGLRPAGQLSRWVERSGVCTQRAIA